MIYRKLKTEETTIQEGDLYATPCFNVAGKLVKQVVSGCSEILRPIPDESEDVVRVEGMAVESQKSPYYQDFAITVEMPDEAKAISLIGQRVTLLIKRPEPPVPKCPYCGMEMEIRHIDAGYWAECSYSNCAVSVIGKARPTRREAIEAMTPKGGGQ